MFKKVSAILLVLCMVVGLLSGCGTTTTTTTTTTSDYIIKGEGGDTTTNDSASGGDTTTSSDKGNSNVSSSAPVTSSPVQQNIKNPLKVDLGGSKITIYTIVQNYFDSSAKATTKSDQARISMLKKLEKELNCKVENKNISASQLQTLAFTTISSGKSFAHIMMLNAHATAGMVANKLAEDIRKISTMDVTKDYLDVGGAVEASTFGGGTWYVAEPINIYASAQGIFFNKRILNEIGYKDSDLYKMVNNKQWTLSKLREIAKKAVKDLDGKAGMTTEDRWGITYIDTESAFAPSVLEACGVKMLTVDAKGNIKYNMEDKDVMNAITLSGEIVKDSSSYGIGGFDKDRVKMFSTGRALFFYAPAANVTAFSDMEDDFGFLPFPSNKTDGKYQTAVNWNSSVLMIPKGLSAKEKQNAGSYLQAYAYLAKDVNKLISDDYTARYFRDDESGENMVIAANGQKLTVAQSIGNTNEAILSGTYRVIWDWVGTKNSAVAPHIQSSKKAAIAAIDEFTKKLK